jgi:hypothetical protein
MYTAPVACLPFFNNVYFWFYPPLISENWNRMLDTGKSRKPGFRRRMGVVLCYIETKERYIGVGGLLFSNKKRMRVHPF